ncbi:MAG TPA: alanine racemase [Devosia sp.]|nr:alanine racemase [Devosia sp.]
MLRIPATGLGPRLTVDLTALQRNWRALEKVSTGALCGAVVKADAYGTGIVAASEALFAAGARFFFTATVDEAVAVRRALPAAHIFVLDGLYPGAAATYGAERLMPCLSSLGMLEEWLAFCLARNEALPAALHFDTGMNRLGIRMAETEIAARRVGELNFSPQMIMSHLACADQPNHEKNRVQLALFQSLLGHFPNIPASLANSAALMSSRDYHFQMVRPGIALYGGRAVNGRRNPMARVVTLEAPVLEVKEARTGESVGYGASYTLARESRIAVLGIGYADGFVRSLSSSNTHSGGRVVLRGRILPVIGRVSMDLVTVDITDLGGDLPLPGEMAEIFGPTLGVDDQADIAGTIGYELLTSLKLGRFQRRYVDGPESEGGAG